MKNFENSEDLREFSNVLDIIKVFEPVVVPRGDLTLPSPFLAKISFRIRPDSKRKC